MLNTDWSLQIQVRRPKARVMSGVQEIGPIVVGTAALVLAAHEATRRSYESDQARRERREARVFEALKWFEGKTQRRNIGIAVVEGAWSETPHLRATLIPLLINQAIYLLAESKQREAAHEADNRIRLMRLITDDLSFRESFRFTTRIWGSF